MVSNMTLRVKLAETETAALALSKSAHDMAKALELAETLLRHLFTTGQKPVAWALHPDSPHPQDVINEVSAALKAWRGE